MSDVRCKCWDEPGTTDCPVCSQIRPPVESTERLCPHCRGSLERYEDPKAVEIINRLETSLQKEAARVDWLLARQYNHSTRESVDADLIDTTGEVAANAVRIDERLVDRIGVREWGLPSLCMPGKIWRSKSNRTITCMLPHEDPSKVKMETLPLVVIPAGEMSWMPDAWRDALWEYVQAWPSSGHGLGPFLAITEEQRCDFIRNWAKQLVASDNIGCCSIANAIGEFAAYGYELVSDNFRNQKGQP